MMPWKNGWLPMIKPGTENQSEIVPPEKTYAYIDEEDDYRKTIYQWSEKRQQNYHGCKRTYHLFLLHTFRLNILLSFIHNFNYMVIIHMVLAGLTIYIFRLFKIGFEMNATMFVSPVVFPLAFSINADFQRREKVLNDLAIFKASSMSFFFSMRDWKNAANLDFSWFRSVHIKINSLLFYLREYLLTEEFERQQVIMRAMYEDFSDLNQLVETFRASNLSVTNGLVSGPIGSLKEMKLAFERLRNVREYQSPRSIRAFTKVFIFLMPIIFAPYFVYLGQKVSDDLYWAPYFLGVLTAFVFGALQGVQDRLDDPFNRMDEDVLHISNIDDWTFQSFDVIVHRTYKVGRFKVTTNIAELPIATPVASNTSSPNINFNRKRSSIFRGSLKRRKESELKDIDDCTVLLQSTSDTDKNPAEDLNPFCEKFSEILEFAPGDVLINEESFKPFGNFKRGSLASINASSPRQRSSKSYSKTESLSSPETYVKHMLIDIEETQEDEYDKQTNIDKIGSAESLTDKKVTFAKSKNDDKFDAIFLNRFPDVNGIEDKSSPNGMSSISLPERFSDISNNYKNKDKLKKFKSSYII